MKPTVRIKTKPMLFLGKAKANLEAYEGKCNKRSRCNEMRFNVCSEKRGNSTAKSDEARGQIDDGANVVVHAYQYSSAGTQPRPSKRDAPERASM